jgi:plastocyanin
MRRIGFIVLLAAGLLAARGVHSHLNGQTKVAGNTVTIEMIGSSNGYSFKPANVTIKVGDSVKWVMVSGGPHNVTFDANGIPAGSQATLAAAMPTPMMPLTGPLLSADNATYTVSFAGAKPGLYKFYCLPHQALNMMGTITVE